MPEAQYTDFHTNEEIKIHTIISKSSKSMDLTFQLKK